MKNSVGLIELINLNKDSYECPSVLSKAGSAKDA